MSGENIIIAIFSGVMIVAQISLGRMGYRVARRMPAGDRLPRLGLYAGAMSFLIMGLRRITGFALLFGFAPSPTWKFIDQFALPLIITGGFVHYALAVRWYLLRLHELTLMLRARGVADNG